MADPGKTGAAPVGDAGATADDEAKEFAALPRSRNRHPALALGAGVLALFLVAKMRDDIRYFFSPSRAEDLGDARTLVSTERGQKVLAEAANRLVRIHGTPDRESGLQVDTKGSWTFTQLFRLLGTNNRLFVHRREDPLPASRAEQDAFEGRLLRFSDLSYEEAIRRYFASHVSATHFFRVEEIGRALAGNREQPVALRDLAGDTVTLGPNDIVAIDVVKPGQAEVALPLGRFADAAAAREALVAKGARVLGPGRPLAERHNFIIEAREGERDRLFEQVSAIAREVEVRQARETIKARLRDLNQVGGGLAVRATVAPEGTPGAAGNGAEPRVLDGIVTIRTLATLQIPPDAYLIEEAELPREHTKAMAIALVLLVFASVNLVGFFRELRR